MRGTSKSLGPKKNAEFERHIEPGKQCIRIKFRSG